MTRGTKTQYPEKTLGNLQKVTAFSALYKYLTNVFDMMGPLSKGTYTIYITLCINLRKKLNKGFSLVYPIKTNEINSQCELF